jgi:hypothetical protein
MTEVDLVTRSVEPSAPLFTAADAVTFAMMYFPASARTGVYSDVLPVSWEQPDGTVSVADS